MEEEKQSPLMPLCCPPANTAISSHHPSTCVMHIKTKKKVTTKNPVECQRRILNQWCECSAQMCRVYFGVCVVIISSPCASNPPSCCRHPLAALRTNCIQPKRLTTLDRRPGIFVNITIDGYYYGVSANVCSITCVSTDTFLMTHTHQA